MMQGLPLEDPFLKLQYGCPAANLVQKMTPGMWNLEKVI
jgi:TetR/AcrR family transcriptional regulator, transcriptional repressor for nem operon